MSIDYQLEIMFPTQTNDREKITRFFRNSDSGKMLYLYGSNCGKTTLIKKVNNVVRINMNILNKMRFIQNKIYVIELSGTENNSHNLNQLYQVVLQTNINILVESDSPPSCNGFDVIKCPRAWVPYSWLF